MKEKRKKVICIVVFTGILLLMLALAVICGEKEIIFPEVGAIAAGMFLTPRKAWRTNGKRMFITLLLCGILGMGIVRFMTAPLLVQLMVAYFLALVIQGLSGTSFMPMVSALVLPVLLQTRSIWYLISLVLFTGLILIARRMLEDNGILEKNAFLPLKRSLPVGMTVFRVVLVGLVILLAVTTNWLFMAAPPLMVAFTELSSSQNKMIRLHPLRIVVLMTLSSIAGAYLRLLFLWMARTSSPQEVGGGLMSWLQSVEPYAGWTGFMTCLSLIAAILVFLPLFYRLGPMLPPAGATLCLPYLIPPKALPTFPIQVFCAIGIYVAASWIRSNLADFLRNKWSWHSECESERV